MLYQAETESVEVMNTIISLKKGKNKVHNSDILNKEVIVSNVVNKLIQKTMCGML